MRGLLDGDESLREVHILQRRRCRQETDSWAVRVLRARVGLGSKSGLGRERDLGLALQASSSWLAGGEQCVCCGTVAGRKRDVA